MFDNENNDFISLSFMMKATPQMEGGRRIVYIEASDESLDAQNEVVLQKSLSDSMEYYLARGNLDIDHITVVGAQQGITDYLTFEIGRPEEVRFHGDKTFVKGLIYSGEGIACEKANQFWSSLTEINPPAKWFPSVGGSIQGSEVIIDPLTKSRQRKITKVRWSNIGFSKQPVNQSISPVTHIPMEVFAKSWAADGCYMKALEMGYGTDSAQLTSGAALRKQSLHGYEKYRDKVAGLILNGVISARDLVDESVRRFSMPEKRAVEWSKKFLNDIYERNQR